MPPLTADEREKRFVEYLLTLNKGQLAELRLHRLNDLANFRRSLMALLNSMIEKRAEFLAAGMLMEFAPERPKPAKAPRTSRPVGDRKRRIPIWVEAEAKALAASRRST